MTGAIVTGVLFVAFGAACVYAFSLVADGWAGGLLLASLVAVAAFALSLVQFYTEIACDRYAEQIGRETKYVELSFFDFGCYVRTGSGWVLRGDQIEVQR
jgi:hypothetical protein